MDSEKVLPPLLKGKLSGHLTVKVDEILWIRNSFGSTFVELQWWGDKESCIFRPAAVNHPASDESFKNTSITFNIRTSIKLFYAYLKKCEKLVFRVYKFSDKEHIGDAVIRDISRVIINNKVHHSYYPIFSENNLRVGELHVSFDLWLTGGEESNLVKRKPALVNTREDEVERMAVPMDREKVLSSVLESGQKLRDAMVMSVLDDSPVDLVDRAFDDVRPPQRAPVTQLADSSKLMDFLLGRDLSSADEELALKTLESISPTPSIIELAKSAREPTNDYGGHCCCQCKDSTPCCSRSVSTSVPPNPSSSSRTGDSSPSKNLMKLINCYKLIVHCVHLNALGSKKVAGPLKKDNKRKITPGLCFIIEHSPGSKKTYDTKPWNIKQTRFVSRKIRDNEILFGEMNFITEAISGNFSWQKVINQLEGTSFKIYWRYLNQRLPSLLGTCVLSENFAAPSGLFSTFSLPALSNNGIPTAHFSFILELGYNKTFGTHLYFFNNGKEQEKKGGSSKVCECECCLISERDSRKEGWWGREMMRSGCSHCYDKGSKSSSACSKVKQPSCTSVSNKRLLGESSLTTISENSGKPFQTKSQKCSDELSLRSKSWESSNVPLQKSNCYASSSESSLAIHNQPIEQYSVNNIEENLRETALRNKDQKIQGKSSQGTESDRILNKTLLEKESETETHLKGNKSPILNINLADEELSEKERCIPSEVNSHLERSDSGMQISQKDPPILSVQESNTSPGHISKDNKPEPCLTKHTCDGEIDSVINSIIEASAFGQKQSHRFMDSLRSIRPTFDSDRGNMFYPFCHPPEPSCDSRRVYQTKNCISHHCCYDFDPFVPEPLHSARSTSSLGLCCTGPSPSSLSQMHSTIHEIIISVDSISGFPMFASYSSEDIDCFVDYVFPVSKENHLLLPKRRSSTEVSAVSDEVFFSSVKKHTLSLPSKTSLTRTLNTLPLQSIDFYLWGRFYNQSNHSQIDYMLAKAILPADRLCSLELDFIRHNCRETIRDRVRLPLLTLPCKVAAKYGKVDGTLQVSFTYKSYSAEDMWKGGLIDPPSISEEDNASHFQRSNDLNDLTSERMVTSKNHFHSQARNSSNKSLRNLSKGPSYFLDEEPTKLPSNTKPKVRNQALSPILEISTSSYQNEDKVESDAAIDSPGLVHDSRQNKSPPDWDLSGSSEIICRNIQLESTSEERLDSFVQNVAPTSQDCFHISSFSENSNSKKKIGDKKAPGEDLNAETSRENNIARNVINEDDDTLRSVSSVDTDQSQEVCTAVGKVPHSSGQVRTLAVGQRVQSETKATQTAKGSCTHSHVTPKVHSRATNSKGDFFKARVEIERAVNLPVSNLQDSNSVKPSSYVSFQAFSDKSPQTFTSGLAMSTLDPEWNALFDVMFPVEYLYDCEKKLTVSVVMVAHVDDTGGADSGGRDEESHLGGTPRTGDLPSLHGLDGNLGPGGANVCQAVIDLTSLSAGLPDILGWFFLLHSDRACGAQIKVKITPLQDITKYKERWFKEYSQWKKKKEKTKKNNVEPASQREIKISNKDTAALSLSLNEHLTELEKITANLEKREAKSDRGENNLVLNGGYARLDAERKQHLDDAIAKCLINSESSDIFPLKNKGGSNVLMYRGRKDRTDEGGDEVAVFQSVHCTVQDDPYSWPVDDKTLSGHSSLCPDDDSLDLPCASLGPRTKNIHLCEDFDYISTEITEEESKEVEQILRELKFNS